MSTMFWIWMAAAVVFLIIELLTPTMIVINFAFGAFVAAVVSEFFPEAYYWQFGIFAVLSIVGIPLTRRFANRISKPAPELSNVDRMIGRSALVIEAIDPAQGGKVKFEGETWVAQADEPIEADTRVRIVQVSGTHVKVERETETMKKG
jgi:membrane protein implicated in regulation of membrane protease activity